MGSGVFRILKNFIHFFHFSVLFKQHDRSIIKIDGTMDGAKYKAILEAHMLPFATDRMAPGWKMFQDNDSKHRCSLMIGKLKKLPDGRKFRTFGWFKLNHVDAIKSPPYSPDLNPIEKLFSIVKKKL